MAKAIKLPDGYYWDSSSVSHNRQNLDKLLNFGKYIKLTKNKTQPINANVNYVVNWEVEKTNTTNGILVKNGNRIKCTSGNHNVLIITHVTVNSPSGSNFLRYLYLHKVSDNTNEMETTTMTYGGSAKAITVMNLSENDCIEIHFYSENSNANIFNDTWNELTVILLD